MSAPYSLSWAAWDEMTDILRENPSEIALTVEVKRAETTQAEADVVGLRSENQRLRDMITRDRAAYTADTEKTRNMITAQRDRLQELERENASLKSSNPRVEYPPRLMTYLHGLQSDGSDFAVGIATDILYLIGENK